MAALALMGKHLDLRITFLETLEEFPEFDRLRHSSRALGRSRADEIHLQGMSNPKSILAVKDSTQAE
jgi:hypothetical protein